MIPSAFVSSLANFANTDLEKWVSDLSITVVTAGAAALVMLVFLAVMLNKRLPQFKPALFILILIVVLGTTVTISGSTIYLNVKSATGGPVHWHADIEFWACDNELELRDPIGLLSNKIGTPTLHEHNDKRIHLEGVPVTMPEDASLGKFMRVIGGEISDGSLTIPLNNDKYFEDDKGEEDGDGPAVNSPEHINRYIKTQTDGTYAQFISGQTCGDQKAELQVFVYQFNEADNLYKQTKIKNPQQYAIARHSQVPPGDCIVVEFGPTRQRTDRLCKQYGIRDIDRCDAFGVEASKRKVCEAREIR